MLLLGCFHIEINLCSIYSLQDMFLVIFHISVFLFEDTSILIIISKSHLKSLEFIESNFMSFPKYVYVKQWQGKLHCIALFAYIALQELADYKNCIHIGFVQKWLILAFTKQKGKFCSICWIMGYELSFTKNIMLNPDMKFWIWSSIVFKLIWAFKVNRNLHHNNNSSILFYTIFVVMQFCV